MASREERRARAAAAAEKRAGLLTAANPEVPTGLLTAANPEVPSGLLTAANPEVPAFSPRRKFTEEQFQKWSQVFNQEGGNGKVKCIVERPSYLSADALAQMEGGT
jgi:hypothetical protein